MSNNISGTDASFTFGKEMLSVSYVLGGFDDDSGDSGSDSRVEEGPAIYAYMGNTLDPNSLENRVMPRRL